MNFLRWLKWLPKLMRELCRRGLVPVFYSSSSLSCLLYLAITLSTFSYVDANSKESRLIIAKEAKGPTSSVHTTKAQSGISQTTQWPKSLLVLEGGDITMGEAPGVTVLDPGSGLLAFLACFDLLEFNILPVSHFHCFGPSFGNFLCLSVRMEALPLLEELFKEIGRASCRERVLVAV